MSAVELKDILRPENIEVGLAADGKRDALAHMCDLLERNGLVASGEAFLADVLEREKLGPTCIGGGIAIPHGKSPQARRPTVAIAKLSAPVSWESHIGEEDVAVVMLFCVSDDAEGGREHLRLLAEMARRLAHDEVVSALRSARSPEDVVSALA